MCDAVSMQHGDEMPSSCHSEKMLWDPIPCWAVLVAILKTAINFSCLPPLLTISRTTLPHNTATGDDAARHPCHDG